MCGRFNLTSPAEVEARFGFVDWHERRIEPRFNIAPSQDILTIVKPAQGAPVLQSAVWGLAPYWRPSGGRNTAPINARAESLASSGMFRVALASGRCLIPATGFYEWRSGPALSKKKTAMHIQLHGGEPFAFAGLWVSGKDGRPTAAIITTAANELVESIHTRMPVILRPEDEALWLATGPTALELVLALLLPYPAEAMHAYPVPPLVNSVANDGPELIVRSWADPSDEPTPQNRQLLLPLLEG